MRQPVRQTIGSAIAVASLSALLIWGGQSLSSSHASSPAASTATPVALTMSTAPSNGFTEVAKAVTPAVVNITTVTTEKVSDSRGVPDELRERMEEFFAGDRSALADSVGRKVLVPVSHGSIGAAGRGPASSYHQTGTF